jgi:hypothetical protein
MEVGGPVGACDGLEDALLLSVLPKEKGRGELAVHIEGRVGGVEEEV